LVFLILFGAVIGMLYLFIRPLIDEVQQFSHDFPTYVRDARAGKGPVGHLIKRYKLDNYVERNKDKIQEAVSRVGTGAISLLGLGVPFSGVLALWVGFADLIPLVGATLGAIPTVGVAFLHSITAGIVMIVVYVVYQQFENHVLQPVIMARTVQLNQLFVLV